MRKLIILLALVLLGATLMAIELSLELPALDGAKNSAEYPLLLKPSEPMLAYYPVKVLLPFGHSFESAQITLSDSHLQHSGFDIDFARAQQPISLSFNAEITQPNADIYQKDALFPSQDWEYLGTQYYRGHAIAVLNVYPFKYNPVKREVYGSRQMQISINTSFDASEAARQAKFVTRSASTQKQLQSLVLNPELASSYAVYSDFRQEAALRNIDLNTPHTMIVITDATRAPWFADYINWRNTAGINTGLYTTEEIYSNYAGDDNAEKIRNFIIAAYSSWSSSSAPLEYVILGGDDEIVPERGVFGKVGDTRDNRMPSDLYFSNLDGNWNANNNSVYGEMQDDVDYLPEVHIGRFPAETYLEFQNIFRKIQYYVDYSTFSNNKAIFYGENLNDAPLTWGGDYKDDVLQYLPNTYDFSTQYQRDASYSSESVWQSINAGANVMNHMGHANETYLMGQGNGTIQALNNTEYGFLYSQGCYPAAFDQRTSANGECIGEHLLIASGGVFAFIGNTRYGWYMPGGINGASQYYDRQYFRGLFQTGYPELGRALTYSRLQNLNAAMSQDVMRWCYMEMVLFGDPSIGVKLPDPDLPMLTLESYHFDDSQGDNDGNINPGEMIRFYPVVRNAAGWATAETVSIRVEATPTGVAHMGQCLYVQSILPGATNPEDLYIELQLPDSMDYGVFTIKIAVESFHPVTNLSTGLQYFDATFEITMFDNRFPWETANAGKSAPIVADFDGDGQLEIMYADVFGGVYLIDHDGEEYSTFGHPDQQNLNRSGAMGAIQNADAKDLAFSSRSGYLYALSSSGDSIFDYNAGSPFLFSPIIADLNGDGQNEVIACALNGKLYVVNADGSDAPGFPVQLSGSFQSELAVGHVTTDSAMQIICGMSGGLLWVVNSDGSIATDHSRTLDSSLTGAPVILDNGSFAIASNSQLYGFDNTGAQVFNLPIDSAVAGGLITADIDRDGNLDIVFVSVSGKLWVVSQAGYSHSGFPVDTAMIFSCPPLVADIDGDEQYEILLHSYINSIFAYEHNGELVAGFPFGTTYNGATPATLVDFDDSGYYKLVAGYSNGILMSNLRRPVSDLVAWTTYRGGLSRQGSFAATGHVSNADSQQVPLPFALQQNYPNPFNPHTMLSFSLSQDAMVQMNIYNTRGQKVRTLHRGELSKGAHSLSWDATDDAGRTLASGLYFYRLESDGRAQTRKMLLMK